METEDCKKFMVLPDRGGGSSMFFESPQENLESKKSFEEEVQQEGYGPMCFKSPLESMRSLDEAQLEEDANIMIQVDQFDTSSSTWGTYESKYSSNEFKSSHSPIYVDGRIEQAHETMNSSLLHMVVKKIPVKDLRGTLNIASNPNCPHFPQRELSYSGPLGSGRFGIVFAGTLRGSKVAVKLFCGENSYDGLHSFREELDIWSTLSHPHIVKLVGYVYDCNTLERGFVMEACESTLHRFLYQNRTSPVSVEEVLTISSGVISALEYIHSRNLVHCDIKPQNILLNECRIPKLCDFDGCVQLCSDGRTNYDFEMHATPAYMAPELFIEPKKIAASADIYSFGVVLWEVIGLQNPFKEFSIKHMQLRTNIQPGMGKCFDMYPAIMKTIVQDCCNRDNESRPEASSLIQALDTVDLTASPANSADYNGSADTAEKSTCIRWRARFKFVVIAAVFLAVMLTLFVYYGLKHGETPRTCTYGNISASCVLNIPPTQQPFVKWECNETAGLCDLHMDIAQSHDHVPFSDDFTVNTYSGVLTIKKDKVVPSTLFLRGCFHELTRPRDTSKTVDCPDNCSLSLLVSISSLSLPELMIALSLDGLCPAADSDVRVMVGSEPLSLGNGVHTEEEAARFRIVPSWSKEYNSVLFVAPYSTFPYNTLDVYGVQTCELENSKCKPVESPPIPSSTCEMAVGKACPSVGEACEFSLDGECKLKPATCGFDTANGCVQKDPVPILSRNPCQLTGSQGNRTCTRAFPQVDYQNIVARSSPKSPDYDATSPVQMMFNQESSELPAEWLSGSLTVLDNHEYYALDGKTQALFLCYMNKQLVGLYAPDVKITNQENQTVTREECIWSFRSITGKRPVLDSSYITPPPFN